MRPDIFMEPGLSAGGDLCTAGFIKELNCWVLQSASPESRNLDEYEKIEQETALKMYPELNELLKLELERNTFFRKGRNSGKWYDFV